MRDTRGVGDRRREIDVQREHAGQARPRRPPGGVPAHHERDADRLLVRRLLLGPPMLPVLDPVVRGEHDQRVLQPAGCVERVQHPAERPVDAEERPVLVRPEGVDRRLLRGREPWQIADPGRLVRDVGLVERGRTCRREVGERVLVAGGRDRGFVRRRRRELEEQRPGGVPDERDRLVREHLGRVVPRTVPERVEGPVDRQGVVDGRRVHERHPPVPTRRDVAGHRRVLVPVDVLAEQPRPVARVVQPRRERRAVVEPLEPTERRDLSVDEVGVGVVAGQDARAAGTAERVHDERVGERHAPAGESLRKDRHRPQGVPALVVGHDQDDVGGLPGLRSRRRARVRGRGRDAGRDRGHEQDRPEGDRGDVPHALRYASSVAASRETSAWNAGASMTFTSS